MVLLGHSLGGQLVAGHEAGHPVADGVVSVGGAIPYFRHFAYGGIPIAVLAGVVVPTTTALFGYLPKPASGGPGAHTFHARMGAHGADGTAAVPGREHVGWVRTPRAVVDRTITWWSAERESVSETPATASGSFSRRPPN